MTFKLLKWWLIFLLLSFYYGSRSQSILPADRILGNYQNEAKTKTISIVKKGESYLALLIKSEQSSETGQPFITDIHFDGSHWMGSFYSRKAGSSFKVALSLPDDKHLLFSVKSRRKTWLRLN